MKVLVTGANGLVGRVLTAALQLKGHSYRAAVRNASANVGEKSCAVIGDISESTEWGTTLQGCTDVVHLAARVHQLQDDGVRAASLYHRTNVDGTLQLARQAAAAGIRRFVFLSSVKVLGECSTGRRPFTEADPACPSDSYGQSKWDAEQGLFDIARTTGMEVVVIRPPLVYGRGVKANFASLMRAVQNGWPLPLGAVVNKRSLVGVENLADFIITCLMHRDAANEVFLVSDGCDLSTAEMVRGLATAANRPARLLPVPVWSLRIISTLMGQGARADRLLGSLQVDISKARGVLGWVPPFTPAQGFRQIFDEPRKP